MENQIENLEIVNPNRQWVFSELKRLIGEWESWQREVAEIIDHEYDSNIQSKAFADGEENMRRHEILQAKTLTFLNNNIRGHGFIKGFDGRHCDTTGQRLKIRVKLRIHDLRILEASLEYAKVPESYWRQKGKDLLDKIADKGTDSAIEIAASYLKNPLKPKE